MTVHAYAAKSPKGLLEPFAYEPGPLGPNEVEVKVDCCGVCHSDLAMIDNDWGFSAYPLIPGHEVIGSIAALGDRVEGLQVGQRVGVGWFCGSCGRCEWCGRGKESLCAQARGTIVYHNGGWADLVRTDAKFALPIPDAIDSPHAGPMMCAGTTVFTPMVEFGVRPWMKTAVVGIGGLGHLAVQFLAAFGCKTTAISTSHDKDEQARALGATDFIATRGTEELKAAANSFDFIMSTVAADVPWVDYISALRPQGRLVLVGVPPSEIHFPAFPLLAEKSVSGGSAGSPSDTLRMLEFAARTGVAPLIEVFPMSEVNAAVERVRSNKVRFRAVLQA
jgi:uncharacterized zinc-type alcohol dehydrogenase-like protein